MHMCLLGVMRKLLHWWIKGKPGSQYKINARNDVPMLGRRLDEYAAYTPSEFGHLSRSTKELERWKAKEFRTFLLYSGIVACKGLLPQHVYDHFVLYVCAMRILVTDQKCVTFNNYANRLMTHFVQEANKIYGSRFMSYNVHGLLHIAKECLMYGNLDNVSAFPFESFLCRLKRPIKKSSSVIEQIVNRCSYDRILSCDDSDQVSNFKLLHEHWNGPSPNEYRHYQQYKACEIDYNRYSTNRRDCCVKVGDHVCEIVNILHLNGKVKIVVQRYQSHTDYFKKPDDSSKFGIHLVWDLSQEVHVHDVNAATKCFLLPADDRSCVAVELSAVRL